ncbi:hypothetical protein D3C81_1881650 [compost metagenome]
MEISAAFVGIPILLAQGLYLVYIFDNGIGITDPLVGFVPQIPEAVGAVEVLMRSVVTCRGQHIGHIRHHAAFVGIASHHQFGKDILRA